MWHSGIRPVVGLCDHVLLNAQPHCVQHDACNRIQAGASQRHDKTGLSGRTSHLPLDAQPGEQNTYCGRPLASSSLALCEAALHAVRIARYRTQLPAAHKDVRTGLGGRMTHPHPRRPGAGQHILRLCTRQRIPCGTRCSAHIAYDARYRTQVPASHKHDRTSMGGRTIHSRLQCPVGGQHTSCGRPLASTSPAACDAALRAAHNVRCLAQMPASHKHDSKDGGPRRASTAPRRQPVRLVVAHICCTRLFGRCVSDMVDTVSNALDTQHRVWWEHISTYHHVAVSCREAGELV